MKKFTITCLMLVMGGVMAFTWIHTAKTGKTFKAAYQHKKKPAIPVTMLPM